jgi:hypothetical protein
MNDLLSGHFKLTLSEKREGSKMPQLSAKIFEKICGVLRNNK